MSPSDWRWAPWTKTTLSTSPWISQLNSGTSRASGRTLIGTTRALVEQGQVHRVHTIATPLVKEQQQPLCSSDRWGARTDAEGTGRGPDDRVLLEFREVAVPVVGTRIPEMFEVIEDGDLHVRVYPVQERNAPVVEVPQDGILVLNSIGSKQGSGVGVEMEALTVMDQPVCTNPPRLAIIRRQVRVRHHVMIAATTVDHLNTWVLETINTEIARTSEQIRKLVLQAVTRREHRDVRHVVDEPRPRTGVGPIRVANGAGEEMELPIVMQQTGVEDRPVARNRARRHDRFVGGTKNRGRPGVTQQCGTAHLRSMCARLVHDADPFTCLMTHASAHRRPTERNS